MEGIQLALQLGTQRDANLVGSGSMGAVFTRRWVVDLILDLSGYTADNDLATKLAVEPACGTGAFLQPMVARLAESAKTFSRDLSECLGAIRAFDLRPENVDLARKVVAAELTEAGLSAGRADRLAKIWVQTTDFLLEVPADLPADFVIGNPPYIRLEDVPSPLMVAYRHACPTMRGRSDVYVGFIERGLRLLTDGGTLGFIVADRWMHNRYGADLRQLVTGEFSVEVILEMHDIDAFEEAVSAYPAITILRKRSQQKAVLATASKVFGPSNAAMFNRWATRSSLSTLQTASISAARVPGWFAGSELWPSGDPQAVALIRSIERRFPPLEDDTTGTRVGIGVATGADGVFLTSDPHVVETDRLAPLAMSEDISTGEVQWTGTYLVNPWTESGLVNLEEFPRLRSYYDQNRRQLEARHIAKARPRTWYRTIDRVWPGLMNQAKLLLPDMKASIHPVLETGSLYPHHNLYYVTSSGWDLEVLGGLLISNIANLFVGTYCVKMRGGCYRFQAQYLRKIRVPSIASLTAKHRRALSNAFSTRDVEKATSISMRLFDVEALPASMRT